MATLTINCVNNTTGMTEAITFVETSPEDPQHRTVSPPRSGSPASVPEAMQVPQSDTGEIYVLACTGFITSFMVAHDCPTNTIKKFTVEISGLQNGSNVEYVTISGGNISEPVSLKANGGTVTIPVPITTDESYVKGVVYTGEYARPGNPYSWTGTSSETITATAQKVENSPLQVTIRPLPPSSP